MKDPIWHLASELLKARLAAGLTQPDAAALCGLTQSNIARIEAGQSNFTVLTAMRLASAYDKKIGLVD